MAPLVLNVFNVCSGQFTEYFQHVVVKTQSFNRDARRTDISTTCQLDLRLR